VNRLEAAVAPVTRQMIRLAHWWRRVPAPARRVGVAAVGAVVMAAGVVMLVVPGPGLLVLGLGIGIMATEFTWARRVLREGSSRLQAGRRLLAQRRSRDHRASGETRAR
jgi:uncharacterized protein (TIGR02611 family)